MMNALHKFDFNIVSLKSDDHSTKFNAFNLLLIKHPSEASSHKTSTQHKKRYLSIF